MLSDLWFGVVARWTPDPIAEAMRQNALALSRAVSMLRRCGVPEADISQVLKTMKKDRE